MLTIITISSLLCILAACAAEYFARLERRALDRLAEVEKILERLKD